MTAEENAQQLPLKLFCPPTPGEGISSGRGHYRIGKPIGKGSFGVVYECLDDWGNQLAAKVFLPRQKPYEMIRDNWLQEINNLLTLRHPNVIFIYDAFECRDTFYIITERCFGSVATLLKMPKYNGEQWIRPIARCLLQAIHFLHDNEYVHKDIHAGNVFTSLAKNEVFPDAPGAITFKLGDLGISKLVGDMNMFNTILAQWMLPPEYLKPAEFGTIDRRMDIYHCGLLFLQILSGRELFFTEEQIIAGEPRILAESLPPPYGSAISKALRRHVSNRTQSAAEFWRDLNILPETELLPPEQKPGQLPEKTP